MIYKKLMAAVQLANMWKSEENNDTRLPNDDVKKEFYGFCESAKISASDANLLNDIERGYSAYLEKVLLDAEIKAYTDFLKKVAWQKTSENDKRATRILEIAHMIDMGE